jgi:hypothetical protein
MFLNQTTYSTGTGTSPRSVTVVDVNSDRAVTGRVFSLPVPAPVETD